MESEDYDTATVKCVVKEVTETIEFHFPDGSRGEVSFKDAARSSVLQTAMDTCREPEADVFELPDELDSNDVQAWVALTSSNLPQNDVEDIAACIMVRALHTTLSEQRSSLRQHARAYLCQTVAAWMGNLLPVTGCRVLPHVSLDKKKVHSNILRIFRLQTI